MSDSGRLDAVAPLPPLHPLEIAESAHPRPRLPEAEALHPPGSGPYFLGAWHAHIPVAASLGTVVLHVMPVPGEK